MLGISEVDIKDSKRIKVQQNVYRVFWLKLTPFPHLFLQSSTDKWDELSPKYFIFFTSSIYHNNKTLFEFVLAIFWWMKPTLGNSTVGPIKI